jgi:hypothetical protein
VMQREADDAVVVGVEGPNGVFAWHRAEGVDERLPEAGPVAARPGRQCDCQPGRARIDGGRPNRKPAVELLLHPCGRRTQPSGSRTAGRARRYLAGRVPSPVTTARGSCGRRWPPRAAGLAAERPGTGSCPGHGRHQSARCPR